MSGVEEQTKLVTRILKGTIKKSEVEKELDRISAKYGADCFNSYVVKKKPKPWSYEDLKELEILSASGAASKEFYLYMAEVSNKLYSKKNAIKKICVGMAIVLAIAGIIFFYINQQGEKNQKRAENQYSIMQI